MLTLKQPAWMTKVQNHKVDNNKENYSRINGEGGSVHVWFGEWKMTLHIYLYNVYIICKKRECLVLGTCGGKHKGKH